MAEGREQKITVPVPEAFRSRALVKSRQQVSWDGVFWNSFALERDFLGEGIRRTSARVGDG